MSAQAHHGNGIIQSSLFGKNKSGVGKERRISLSRTIGAGSDEHRDRIDTSGFESRPAGRKKTNPGE
jgi:hypothetical protein